MENEYGQIVDTKMIDRQTDDRQTAIHPIYTTNHVCILPVSELILFLLFPWLLNAQESSLAIFRLVKNWQ